MLPGSGRGFKPMATPNYPVFVCSSSAKSVSADEPAPAGHPAVPSHTRLPSALPILLPIHRRLCVRPPSRTSSEPLQLRHSTTGAPLSDTCIGYSRSYPVTKQAVSLAVASLLAPSTAYLTLGTTTTHHSPPAIRHLFFSTPINFITLFNNTVHQLAHSFRLFSNCPQVRFSSRPFSRRWVAGSLGSGQPAMRTLPCRAHEVCQMALSNALTDKPRTFRFRGRARRNCTFS